MSKILNFLNFDTYLWILKYNSTTPRYYTIEEFLNNITNISKIIKQNKNNDLVRNIMMSSFCFALIYSGIRENKKN